VRRLASPRLRAYAAVGAVGLVAGLSFGQPAIVAFAAPFVVLMVVGVLTAVDIQAGADASFGRERALEGETVQLVLYLDAPSAMPFDVDVDLAPGLSIATEQAAPAVVGTSATGVTLLDPDDRVEISVSCDRWGVYSPAWIKVTARQGLSQFVTRGTFPINLTLRVYPTADVLRGLLAPVETQLGFGDLVSRRKGDGLEFADLRAYAVGDDFRRINWRVSSSGRGTWVNDRYPERNSDVVLLVDVLAIPRGTAPGLLDVVVGAAASVAAAHLGRHDRVGLITFGEPVRWIEAGMGDVQRYRVLDTLMESYVRHQLLWRGVRVVPPRALPPKALVIGITSLLDERAIEVFGELRARGFDVAVLEREPDVVPREGPKARLARRIWSLERKATRSRFARHGIPLILWEDDDSLAAALSGLETLRRGARRG
jgi:uncharacterized protein (DUF58 family)